MNDAVIRAAAGDDARVELAIIAATRASLICCTMRLSNMTFPYSEGGDYSVLMSIWYLLIGQLSSDPWGSARTQLTGRSTLPTRNIRKQGNRSLVAVGSPFL